MRFSSCFLLALAITPFACTASANDDAAEAFANIFSTVCLKHAGDVDALRSKLKDLPQLASDQATAFLGGRPGQAWPVPDRRGTFVVAIPEGKALCSVYARRVGAAAAEQRFRAIAERAPAPFTSRLVSDTRGTSPRNGATRTVSYEWSPPGAGPALLFMLTTADSETADIQGMASVSASR